MGLFTPIGQGKSKSNQRKCLKNNKFSPQVGCDCANCEAQREDRRANHG